MRFVGGSPAAGRLGPLDIVGRDGVGRAGGVEGVEAGREAWRRWRVLMGNFVLEGDMCE
jgi:hypothetical protein